MPVKTHRFMKKDNQISSPISSLMYHLALKEDPEKPEQLPKSEITFTHSVWSSDDNLQVKVLSLDFLK